MWSFWGGWGKSCENNEDELEDAIKLLRLKNIDDIFRTL
jgi:hypothetical protein